MDESILRSVAKYCQVGDDDEYFDPELIAIINNHLSQLHQLGALINDSFMIVSDEQTWAGVINPDPRVMAPSIQYVQIRSKLDFNPPSSSFLITALKESYIEDEQRIRMALDDIEAGV